MMALPGLRVTTRYRALRQRGHVWLSTYPRVKKALDATGALRGGATAVARGVGVGLFVGLTPTLGFQTGLMIAGCILLRGNFPAAFAVSWVSNPFTVAPLYWSFHALGKAVFGAMPVFARDVWYLNGIGAEFVFALLGSLLVAGPAAVAGYLISLRISAVLTARRLRACERTSGAALR